MKSKISKIITLLFFLSIFTSSVYSYANSNLNGVYTLHSIKDSSNETRYFENGGILEIDNSNVTLKTSTQTADWSINDFDFHVDNTYLYGSDPKANITYVFKRTN